MMTDPVGDMLARIRNAGGARHAEVSCPASKPASFSCSASKPVWDFRMFDAKARRVQAVWLKFLKKTFR